MRTYTFTVFFIGATYEVVYAGDFSSAVILACAERIKKGYHRDCFQIANADTGEIRKVDCSNSLIVRFI